jgi:hypothetical protein
MTLWVLHTLVCIHKHTHTHTHTHILVLEAWGEISAKAEIPGLPECADNFMSQNNHHFQQCPFEKGILPPWGQWRNKHFYMWSHHCNSNHLSKPIMHMNTGLKIFEHTLGIFKEYCTFPHLTGCHSWSLE